MRHLSLEALANRLRARVAGDQSKQLLLKAASGNFLVAVAGTGLAFFLNMFLARWMGVTEFGAYAYALTWITSLSLITTLGRTALLVRFVPGYVVRKEFGLLRGLLRESSWHVTVAGGLAAALAGLVIVSLRGRMHEEVYRAMLLGVIVLLPILGLLALRREALRGLQYTVRSALPEGVVRPLGTMVFALLFMALGYASLSATQALLASIGSAILALALGSYWLSRALPRGLRLHAPSYATREWVWISFPLLLNGFLTYILGATDTLVLGLFASPDVIGTYAVASRMAGLAMFPVVAVGNILAPLIAQQYAMADRTELQRVVTQAAWLSAGSTALEIVGLVVLGPWLLSLFGKGFAVAYVPMVILLGGHLVTAVCGNVGFLMTMTGHHLQTIRILGAAALINVLLCLVLIPVLGSNGAALASAVCETLWNVAMVVYVRKHVRINPTPFGRRCESLPLGEESS